MSKPKIRSHEIKAIVAGQRAAKAAKAAAAIHNGKPVKR